MAIYTLNIQGFKSIKHAQIRFDQLNVLIGQNGAGKSNLLSGIRLLSHFENGTLSKYVGEEGGANQLLFDGVTRTNNLLIKAVFGPYENNFFGIEVILSPDKNDSLFADKVVVGQCSQDGLFVNSLESNNIAGASYGRLVGKGYDQMNTILKTTFVYHFNDTSITSPLRRICDVNDNFWLKQDGSNIAAIIFKMYQDKGVVFKILESTISSVFPEFEEFVFPLDSENREKVFLSWKEKERGLNFRVSGFSDGTLRFIALVVAILQPAKLPVIILDEPEIGLHPAAIQKLTSLIRSYSIRTQFIIATQSVTLLNQFDANNIIVAERTLNSSAFKKLDQKLLTDWLDDYSIGELWEKNVLGGRP